MKTSVSTMSKIVGNDDLRHSLSRDILSGTLSHAYIIEGAQGSGRRTLALNVAAAMACIEGNKGSSGSVPCYECIHCKKILERKSPDVIFVGSDGKASVGVDAIRFIKEDVHVIPNDLEHKFYIIEDADKMTSQAQNALLLTLEEPPSFVHFFLISENSGALLETIRSRAPILRTQLLSDKCIDEYVSLNDRRALMMKEASPEEYTELIRAANGTIGSALALLDTKLWSSIAQQRSLAKTFVLSAVESRSAKDVLPMLQSFSTKRDILSEQLSLILAALRDLILLKKSEDALPCFFSDRDEAICLCDRVSITFLNSLYNAVSAAIDENKRNANVKLLLTKMLLEANLI